jgi:hypothetical protein
MIDEIPNSSPSGVKSSISLLNQSKNIQENEVNWVDLKMRLSIHSFPSFSWITIKYGFLLFYPGFIAGGVLIRRDDVEIEQRMPHRRRDDRMLNLRIPFSECRLMISIHPGRPPWR